MALGNMNDISEAIRAAAESKKNEKKRWNVTVTTVASATVRSMFPSDSFVPNTSEYMRFYFEIEEISELDHIIERGPSFEDIINITIKYNF